MAEKKTKTERLNLGYLIDSMERFEWDMHHKIMVEGRIPSEWSTIWHKREAAKRDRVTVRVDSDVLRFFKSMGPNYGPRMNNVLRSFMYARLAGLIEKGEGHPELLGSEFEGQPKPEYMARVAYVAGRAETRAAREGE